MRTTFNVIIKSRFFFSLFMSADLVRAVFLHHLIPTHFEFLQFVPASLGLLLILNTTLRIKPIEFPAEIFSWIENAMEH